MTAFTPEVVTDPGAIRALAPAWRDLVRDVGAPPFCSPDWLLPWQRHYAARAEAFLLTWRDEAGLAGVMPLVRRRRRLPPVTELAPWGNHGTSLRGLVDLVARPDRAAGIAESLVGWLGGPEARWDILSLLRLPPGSETSGRLAEMAAARGYGVASNTGVVRSDTYVLDLPRGEAGGMPVLGPKARHNLRTEAHRFERFGGRYERPEVASAAADVVRAVRELSEARWGPAERTFRTDPQAEPFLAEALGAMAGVGSLLLDVARDATGIRAALATLVVGRRAVALLIGVSADEDLRRVSLGKQLFVSSIDACIERGVETYDFLWVGGYKEAFWGATPRRLESLVVGRGPIGGLVVRRVRSRAARAREGAA
ncbi:MAG: GNAT family N-acetyltransferase [Chloroflexota bacterium]|nr:GNAT family N-acetyltransferase [Chloroflexota bacterium]